MAYIYLSTINPSLKIKRIAERIKTYQHFLKHQNVFDFTLVKKPNVLFKDIIEFEKQHSNVSVNLYTKGKEKHMQILKVCKTEKRYHLNLFVSKLNGINNLIIIKDFNSFFRIKINYKTCKFCFQAFSNDKVLSKHLQNGDCRIPHLKTYFPKQTHFLMDATRKMYAHPILIFADCETLMTPVESSSRKRKTSLISRHEPFACAYALIINNKLIEVKYFHGKSCIIHFLNRLLELADYYVHRINMNRTRYILSQRDIKHYKRATRCGHCYGEFTEDDPKVLHHSHTSIDLWAGNTSYLGAIHRSCNLNLQLDPVLYVYYHNLNYDVQFILQNLGSTNIQKVSCIAKSSEKFMQLIFDEKETMLDTFNYFPTSLESLVEGLKKEPKFIFQLTATFFKRKIPNVYDIIGKGSFPYEHVSWDNLYSPLKEIPLIDAYYSSFKQKAISETEHNHAQKLF